MNTSTLRTTKWEPYKDTAKADPKLKHEFPSTFLDSTMSLLSTVPLVRNDTGLVDAEQTIKKLINDDPNIGNLLGFLYYINRGALVYGTMKKNPRFGTLTPLFMYAHKLYNDIGYGEWDKNVSRSYLNLVLGNRSLALILDTDKAPDFSVEKINDLRNRALTYRSGAKAGTIAALTDFKMSIQKIEKVTYPKMSLYMWLQIWIANAELRDTSAMILDPITWGNVPEPWDAVVQPQIAAKAAYKMENEIPI